MYNIKNHRLDVLIGYSDTWAATEYFFCLAWLPETQKVLNYKSNITAPDKNIIDQKINNVLQNEFFTVTPILMGQVKDAKKIKFLWKIEHDNDYCYFDSVYVGWILYRLNKLKLDNITYKYNPEIKLLLILAQDEIIGGVMGLNISEEEVDNG